MSNQLYDVVVIGGGPAGVTAALRARELGAAVALVERGLPGGTCTNDGCLPTRVLARAARLARDARQLAAYGLSAAPPALDFAALLAHAQQMIYTVHEKKQIVATLQASGVDAHFTVGQAAFAGPQTLALADGRQLEARAFIICAGGHARRLDFPGAALALTHSDVWRMRTLPRSVAVIGAAATGCQLASIFAAFGARVTLLELAPRILPGEDEAVSAALDRAFRDRGIDVVTGLSGVERIDEQDGATLRLTYQCDGARTLDVEAVVLAVGWPGNIEGLGVEAAGVQTERGYIAVDDGFRTSAPHIFAAGDITGRMMLVQSATSQARVAAENAVLGGGARHRHAIVPHGGFTDPEYASVGLTEAQARSVGGCVSATVPFAAIDRAVIDSRTEGFCKLLVSPEDHRMLGAHVVGEQAVEIVHVVAAGMAAGMRVETLAELEIAYPTYTAVLGLAAREIVRQLGVMPLTREWHIFGRPHAEWERQG
jgi:pyruvate/2-oxoglutarate dehydrogenase complex dihydrolipoamide dehydrogenase (E3) component